MFDNRIAYHYNVILYDLYVNYIYLLYIQIISVAKMPLLSKTIRLDNLRRNHLKQLDNLERNYLKQLNNLGKLYSSRR